MGSQDGNVYALDADGGALLWKFETRGPVWSSPLISGGTVYIGSNDNHVYALKAGGGTPALARPSPSATPIATSPFVPLSPAELKAKLEFVFSTDVKTIGEARVSSGGEVRTFIRDYSEDVLAIFETGYYLLMGLTPREDGWIPRVLPDEEYVGFIDENEGGDVDLKLALAFCCHRTSEGLELIINGSAPLPTVISSLAHEAGHARQRVLNPVQGKFRRDSNVGAIREAQAYSFQAALVRKLGDYAGMNTTKVPVHSTAARYFDGWRVLWRDQFDDVTLEHERGALLLWLGALHDPLLADVRAELISQYILSPESLLAIHNRLIKLAPVKVDQYIMGLHAYFTNDFNLIGGTLTRRKGDVGVEGFVEHAPIVFVIP